MAKYCEVGKHEVPALWKARRVNKATGEVIQEACCKSCMARQPIKQKPPKQTALKKELNVFFAEQALVFPKACENCGGHLDRSSVIARRSQTCHILPKSEKQGFPTVGTHPQNRIFMCCYGGCHGHGDWDNLNARKRKSMPVYQIAVERFRAFENHLTTKEKMKAYKYLGLDTSEIK